MLTDETAATAITCSPPRSGNPHFLHAIFWLPAIFRPHSARRNRQSAHRRNKVWPHTVHTADSGSRIRLVLIISELMAQVDVNLRLLQLIPLASSWDRSCPIPDSRSCFTCRLSVLNFAISTSSTTSRLICSRPRNSGSSLCSLYSFWSRWRFQSFSPPD